MKLPNSWNKEMLRKGIAEMPREISSSSNRIMWETRKITKKCTPVTSNTSTTTVNTSTSNTPTFTLLQQYQTTP